jgi:phage terminase small subunit
MEKIEFSEIFRDAEAIYREAVANVRENGAVCAHPRTGTPIENPYLKIMAQYGAALAKMMTQTQPVFQASPKNDPYAFLKKGKK